MLKDNQTADLPNARGSIISFLISLSIVLSVITFSGCVKSSYESQLVGTITECQDVLFLDEHGVYTEATIITLVTDEDLTVEFIDPDQRFWDENARFLFTVSSSPRKTINDIPYVVSGRRTDAKVVDITEKKIPYPDESKIDLGHDSHSGH